MFQYLRPLILVALLAQIAAAADDFPTAKLQRLASDLAAAIEPAPNQPALREAPGARGALGMLNSAIPRQDFALAEAALQQLAASVGPEELRARCKDAAAEMGKLHAAHDKAVADEVARAFQQASETLRSAKKPADLDGVAQELGKLKRLAYPNDSVSRNGGNNEIEPAIRFVEAWQDYLAASQAGDSKAAQSTLDRIISEHRLTLLPRSEILARRYAPPPRPAAAATATPEPKSDAYTLKLGSPDDLQEASETLIQWLQTKSVPIGERGTVEQVQRAVTKLAAAYQEFKQGLPTNLEIIADDETRYGRLGPVIAPIRSQLIKMMLPRYLGLPEDTKAKADETSQQFLQRVAEDAVKKGDYLLAARARETQTLLRDGKQGIDNRQTTWFIGGQNQENAGEFAVAVTSYERALAVGVDLIPPKVIGERLARIKAEHPHDYEAGLAEFLTSRLPPMPTGDMLQMLGHGAPPPNPHARSSPPFLSVPGVTNSATPGPSPHP